MRPAIRSHFPARAVAPLLSYSDLSFEVWEAGRPSNRVRVLEINEYRAITAAGIALGVSAEKLRALPVANVSIIEARTGLDSSLLC